MSFERGSSHPDAKLTESDVALARLLAADRAQYRGWISDMAYTLGVTDVAVVMAIGGRSWAWMHDPKPVPAFRRHHPQGRAGYRAPTCPLCKHRKCYPVHNGRPCRAHFHKIDHRIFTSPINARKAHAVNRRRTRA